MPSDLAGIRRVAQHSLAATSTAAIVLALAGCLAGPAHAEDVPFTCSILPGDELASISITNALAVDASCIVTCKFATTKYDNNPQITCAKAVPAGKEVEMCRLTSGGEKYVKLTEGHADCVKLSNPVGQ